MRDKAATAGNATGGASGQKKRAQLGAENARISYRRTILGKWVMERPEVYAMFEADMDSNLTRKGDRVVFGLQPHTGLPQPLSTGEADRDPQ